MELGVNSSSIKKLFAIVAFSQVSTLVQAQDSFFIQHKPTQAKMQVCSGDNGKPVTSRSGTNTGECVQWERIPNGEFFHLRSVHADKLIKPDTNENGSPISIQPLAWTGNWTQWSYEDRGDGYGHIVNRATGKLIFLSGKNRDNISQQPAAWRGDFTRWRFVSISDIPIPTITPTPLFTETPVSSTPTPSSVPTINPTLQPTPVPPTPTPDSNTPSSEPSSVTIEAEQADLIGGSSVYDDGAASGGQGVAFLDAVGRGVRFNNVPLSDSLIVNYASQNTGTISVMVNGVDSGDITFDSTGGWGGSYQESRLSVAIPQGATVAIVNNPGDLAMNIDSVTFISGSGVTPAPTPTPSATPNPAATPTPQGCEPVDPAADRGEGYVFGMTKSGLVYHRATDGHEPDFAILGIQGAGAELPETGPYEFTEDTTDRTYLRYEAQVIGVDPQQSYTLELRLHGIGSSGQCIHDITVKPGEGVTESPCFDDPDGDAPPPPIKPSVDLLVIDADQLQARLVGGTASGKRGFSLYTTSSTCTGSCLDIWPRLTVEDPDKFVGSGGVTGTYDTVPVEVIAQDDCGNDVIQTVYHVTYNGQPLYFYANDTDSTSTAGSNIPNWDLATADLIEQMPLIDTPFEALPSPMTGGTPGSHGYVFDLDGSSIAVRGGQFWNLLVHPSVYVDGPGEIPTGAIGNNDLQMWCSKNQIQWHMGDLDPVARGQFEGVVPGECWGDYYYFFRFERKGLINFDPGSRWTYSGLFTTAGDRVDANNFPASQGRQISANWDRPRHPHAHDGSHEGIFGSQHNSDRRGPPFPVSLSSANGITDLNVGSVIRIEALENGAIQNFVPVYNYNSPTCCGEAFNYGNVITFEITKIGGSGAQVYSGHINAVAGDGFNSPLGDPRLTLAGAAATNMVFSDEGSHIQLEKNAVFTQHVNTATSREVGSFLSGHHDFHGVPRTPINSTALDTVKIGEATCGGCHFRDGRGSIVVDTPKGPLIPPPVFGTGLLTFLERGSAKLSWDGSNPTIEAQVDSALVNDHKIDLDNMPFEVQRARQGIIAYNTFLSVPNRKPGSIDIPGVAEGQVLFHQVGCVDCHTENQRTSSNAPEWARNLILSPFTDMELHDIGTGGAFRTAPLWGLGTNIEMLERNGRDLLLLHDGRATSVSQAIEAHSGEASSVMNNYNNLGSEEKGNIVKFIETL